MDRLADALAFMSTHARALDRRRFDAVMGSADPDALIAALLAYRNEDGGFGWGIEPDLRSPASQPAGALHAFEALADAVPATTAAASALCDWLLANSLADGGLPFATAAAAHPGTAPLWTNADPDKASLLLTCAIAAKALAVARHDPAVAGHPWLEQVSRYCLERIEAMTEPGFVLEFRYALWFLDAAHDVLPAAPAQLERLARMLPPSAEIPVPGGKAGERMRPLDFSPLPGRPLREHIDPARIEADLDALESEQRSDGGWDVDWQSYSPAAALEWRGWATVRAAQILRAARRV